MLTAEIIDIFEDFLEEKGIVIENDEKAEAIAKAEDPETICNIYGTDFGNLRDSIESLLIDWGLAEPRERR